MKTKICGIVIAVMVAMGLAAVISPNALAEPEAQQDAATESNVATSISISPVSKILQLEPNQVYEDTFKVKNNGTKELLFEVSAAPYAYSFSEAYDEYRLGFNNENAYTQITRWVSFANAAGEFVASPEFTAQPGESVVVRYRISTPASIPGGGQYAVLFARTKSPDAVAGAIKMEASAGLIIYGRSTGDAIEKSEISGMGIHFPTQTAAASDATGEREYETVQQIGASAKVKNAGNVDFMASGKLTVESFFGAKLYETPEHKARVSIIPESELAVSDTWEETPYFGFFKVIWTVDAAGASETISQVVIIMPPMVVIGAILLLTMITIWIIIIVRKRKAHRSRLAI